MAVREFNGTTDLLACGVGAASGMTYGTGAALVKFSNLTGFRAVGLAVAGLAAVVLRAARLRGLVVLGAVSAIVLSSLARLPVSRASTSCLPKQLMSSND